MEHLILKKEKKIDFFELIVDLHKAAKKFWDEIPYNQWIPFKLIPIDIFHLVFNYIDSNPAVTVDRDYKEFLIMKKPGKKPGNNPVDVAA
jgi:hypothetical protein